MVDKVQDENDLARAYIRVNLPEVDPVDLAALRKAILSLVKVYPGAEVELTILPMIAAR